MGNAFLQTFLRGAPAALRAVQGFGAKAAPRVLRQVVDTATNPQTYRALAAQAENVLQRGLPAGFSGANFGNIPARFTGLISDVSRMPGGLARTTQANMVSRSLQEAAGNAPPLSRSVQQSAGGALRAPSVGASGIPRGAVAASVPGPIDNSFAYARDPALRREFLRQFGNTSKNAARILSGGTSALKPGPSATAFPFDNPLTFLQGRARYLGRQGLTSLKNINPGQLTSLIPGGATGLRGSAVLGGMGGMAWGLADPMPLIKASSALRNYMTSRGIIPDPRKGSGIVSSLGPNYKQAELEAGAAAESFRRGAGLPSQQRLSIQPVTIPEQQSSYQPPATSYQAPVVSAAPPSVVNLAPAERNYELEKMRAAQLAEQDQLSKKYKIAELTKAYNTAPDDETKNRIGLEIWATTNPELAQQLSPEQQGYAAPAPAVSNDQEAMIRYLFNRGLQ